MCWFFAFSCINIVAKLIAKVYFEPQLSLMINCYYPIRAVCSGCTLVILLVSDCFETINPMIYGCCLCLSHHEFFISLLFCSGLKMLYFP
jgi:hypothetical protein